MSWTIKVEPSDLNPILFPFDRWTWVVRENDHMPSPNAVGHACTRERAFAKAERRIEEILFERAIAPRDPNFEIREYVPRRERGPQT